jgi:hypothetical protein
MGFSWVFKGLRQNAMSLGPEVALTGICWGKMREIAHLEDAGVEGEGIKIRLQGTE